MNNQAIAVRDELNVTEVTQQVAKIQEIMRAVMKKDEHYGVIPGTNKPSLLKPGAEKLGFTFRLVVDEENLKITEDDMGGGHKNFRVVCPLIHAPSGTKAGAGIGSCNTRETRYRFRNEFTPLDEEPPKDWKTNKGFYKSQGKTFKKIDEQWIWGKQLRVEHDNPADYYNTCEKMAKKRAFVDAILTATAASDFFTQDMEDLKANIPDTPVDDKKQNPKKITEAQRKRMFKIAKENGLNDDDLKKVVGAYGYESSKDIDKDNYDKIIDEISFATDMGTDETKLDDVGDQ